MDRSIGKLLHSLMIHHVHSSLELVRDKLVITPDTKVENFRDSKENEQQCQIIFDHCIRSHAYELSYNQMANGINLLLQAWKNNNKNEIYSKSFANYPLN